jgi:hypothetical protein
MNIVSAASVADFIDRYYKPDRLNDMPGRRERIIADRENDIANGEYAIITRHDSITGRCVGFLPAVVAHNCAPALPRASGVGRHTARGL